MPGGVRTEIHLGAEQTDGRFCLLVDRPPAGWSLPAHLHKNAAETLYVLEGEFEITLADRSVSLAAGQSLHIPAGAVHASATRGSGGGRRVVIFSPAGMERFFSEAGAASAGAAVDADALLALAIRHGWEFASEPPRGR
jgi:mannose-6-phosphate isomerase-like protein (cupin superfamily)